MDTQIINFLSHHHVSIIFLGAFFFGETVIIAAAYLAAQGLWSPATVFLLAFFGTMASDICWFWIGGKFHGAIEKRASYQVQQQKYAHFLKKLTGEKPFLALLFIKFLYGTRILTLLYLSMRKVRMRYLVIYNAIGTIFWLAVIIPIGWLTQKGLTTAVPLLGKLEYSLLGILMLIILIKILFLWINRITIEK
ncbi:MAG: VTT domain-containing protein [Candidatus Kerfeldbacteria bacterium]|nr:VTT domain-containing protein [Candidatus Kerfeldbacteria bacterium]